MTRAEERRKPLTLRRATAALAAAVGSLLLASTAQAATTLTVDDDRTDCPAAQYTSIQAAVDAAARRHRRRLRGRLRGGHGCPGTNAITISKSITLKGAGAGLVHISPKATTPTGGQILEASPSIRNGIGDIIAVDGTPSRPLTVDISRRHGRRLRRRGPRDRGRGRHRLPRRKGSVDRAHVTNVVTSEGDTAYTSPAAGAARSPASASRRPATRWWRRSTAPASCTSTARASTSTTRPGS